MERPESQSPRKPSEAEEDTGVFSANEKGFEQEKTPVSPEACKTIQGDCPQPFPKPFRLRKKEKKMKIVDLVCSKARTGFFFDDQRAIKKGAVSDGAAYFGETVTPGFKSVRQAGEAISVMLILEDGQIAWGDCAAVQYSGAGGRDPLFLAEDFIPIIEKHIKPELVGKEADSFKGLCEMLENIQVDDSDLSEAYGDNLDSYLETYGTGYVKRSAMLNKVAKFMADGAVIVENSETEAAEATAEAE